MSNPFQPLSPDRLYKFAERMGSVERAVSSVIADSDRDKRRREETDSRKIHKFARYRLARAKKVDGNGGKTYEDVYDYITKEELDYYLKKALEEPPEARYQRKKDNTFFHDSVTLEDAASRDMMESAKSIHRLQFHPAATIPMLGELKMTRLSKSMMTR